MNSLLLLTIVSLASLAVSQRRDNTLPECFEKVADVFFVLDSSTSIYIEDYQQVLEFVSQVVTRFDVSSDDTRIAALTFSDDFQVGFELDRFRTKGELLASVNERTLPYRTGVTNTDLAIRYVREARQFRDDITKVMVVITDGGSRSPASTRREADLARDAGFHMVVVGVGQYLDEQEWRYIASDPDNDYVFNITNFNFLSSLRDSLPRRICLMPPIIIGGECTVTQDADLLFLGAPNSLNDGLDVTVDLAEAFRAPDLQVRYIFGACTDRTDNGFEGPDAYCERFGDALAQDDQTYVNLLNRLRSGAQAMREERERNYALEGRAPPLNVNQVAVLFVDDQSMRANRFGILQETRRTEQIEGIDIVVVDMGVRDYSNFLRGMTSNPQNIINFEGQSFSRSVRQILDSVCDLTNSSPFGDTRVS